MELLTFKKYSSKNDLAAVCKGLENHSIDYDIDDSGNSLDSTFGNSVHANDYILKIRKADFEKANSIIEQLADEELLDVNEEHFLFDFSNDELKDVIKKRDEWGDFNFSLAKKILKDRGEGVDAEAIKGFERERIEELSKPEDDKELFSRVIGYVSAFLGGPLGLLIGYYLSNFKKTLPNGESVYYYSNDMRRHGRLMIFIGIISSIGWLILKLLKS